MDDRSVAEPGNSVGSGASDAISAGDATEHNCGVAAMYKHFYFNKLHLHCVITIYSYAFVCTRVNFQ